MIDSTYRILVQGQGYLPINNFVNQTVELWDGETFVASTISDLYSETICRIFSRGNDAVEISNKQNILTYNNKEFNFINAEDVKYRTCIVCTPNVPDFDFLKLSFQGLVMNENQQP